MTTFDSFANQLIEEAKRFLEKATESTDNEAVAAYLHASLMLGFCAFEAHINSICEEFANFGQLSAHEKGFLLECEVRLEDGDFVVHPSLKMVSLEDRFEFLHGHFGGRAVDKGAQWWSDLTAASKLRNSLTHAKAVPALNSQHVEKAILAIVAALDALYLAVYKRPFPPAGQALQSKMVF
jgi:hypothetical protein